MYQIQNDISIEMKSILYIYTGGREERINKLYVNNTPVEMLYGYSYFKDKGYPTDFIELCSIQCNQNSISYRLLHFKNRLLSKKIGIGINSHYFLGILRCF